MARLRRSLLTRVALSFAAAVALTAIALSLAAYYVTKHDQDTGSLSDALEQSRQNLIVADAMLPPAPVQADYEALMTAFTIRGDFDTLIQTGTETYRSGLDVDEDSVTAELAAAVATGNVRYQTVDSEVGPVIVVGSQLRGGRSPSTSCSLKATAWRVWPVCAMCSSPPGSCWRCSAR